MKDPSLTSRFETLARLLLPTWGLHPVQDHGGHEDQGYDFVVEEIASGDRAVVEVKLYKSLQVSRSVLVAVSSRLLEARSRAGTKFALLFTNLKIDAASRAEFLDRSFVIYDYDVIGNLVKGSSQFAAELEDIYQHTFIYRSDPLPAVEPRLQPQLDQTVGEPPPAREPRAPKKGDLLCRELRRVRAGKGRAATEFEQKCEECLRYLFDGDLIGWTPQKYSQSSLHRYDIIARVSSKTEFWNSLISDYRARYIIFEFKNNGDRITQKEIYSTEKYLLPVAMRSMAIIISRKGANENARRVMSGALREAGKVILCVSIDQICDMLHKKDNGEEPSAVLSETLDEILTRLER